MAKPKRGVGRPKTTPDDHFPPLAVRGLTAEDHAALDEEHARRQAELPSAVKLSRNALVIMLIREALAASKARSEKGGA